MIPCDFEHILGEDAHSDLSFNFSCKLEMLNAECETNLGPEIIVDSTQWLCGVSEVAWKETPHRVFPHPPSPCLTPRRVAMQ
jgi:hypothetical protein